MNSLTNTDNDIDPVSLLKCYVEWGVDETITDEPIDRFTEIDNIQSKQNAINQTSSNALSIILYLRKRRSPLSRKILKPQLKWQNLAIHWMNYGPRFLSLTDAALRKRHQIPFLRMVMRIAIS